EPLRPRFQQTTRLLKQGGQIIGLGVIGTSFMFICLVLLIGLLIVVDSISRKSAPTPRIVYPKSAPFATPKDKIVLLRLKLSNLRENPNANPAEIKLTEEELAHWEKIVDPQKTNQVP